MLIVNWGINLVYNLTACMEIFVEISSIILLVTGVSLIMRLLKQPLIVGYILTGILVGPYALDLIQSKENIEFLSKLGITMLLFIVGLGLNPKVLRETGKISLITGLGQVIFTSAIGYIICRLLGIDNVSSIYVSIALTFSSTIIILKLLTDKGDVDTLYGKIAIGFLLVQDLIATIILIALSSLANSEGISPASIVGLLVLKGVAVGIVLTLIAHKILPKVLSFIASTQELLFLFSITWGMIIASIFFELGFSIEIGALVAGAMFSSTPYASEIGSRMKPLRDFLLLLFFVLLGSQMVLDTLPQILLPSIVLSLFVLIGNPIIVIILMNLLGYKRKTGFMAGLTVAQISEFSLILAALGLSLGHINQEMLSLITLVGLFTISGSTYMILYSDRIYKLTERLIKILEYRKITKEKSISISEPPDIILFGYDRAGSDFVNAVKKLGKSFVVVDHNPRSIDRLKEKDLPYAYGDADDAEFLEDVGLKNAKMIISTIPDNETNKLIVRKLKGSNPKAMSIIISHHVSDAKELYKIGASYVIMPIYLGAHYAAHMIRKHGFDAKSFAQEREKHLEHLSTLDR
jgi:Kef-type K+ transport system membrane component KefB